MGPAVGRNDVRASDDSASDGTEGLISIITPERADPRWTAMWLVWIAAFFGIELTALARKRPQDTLSDHVWAWFDIPRHPAPSRQIRLRRLALLGLLAWLVGHFLTGDDI